MRHISLPSTNSLAALAVGLVALGCADATGPGNEIRRIHDAQDFEWRGLVAQGHRIEIRGVNGAVRATMTSGSEVEVIATENGTGSFPAPEVRIEVVTHAEGVTICARYPDRNGDLNECPPDGGNISVGHSEVQISFAVRVPAGVDFVGRTVNGVVEAVDLLSDVSVSSVNGDVRVSTAGLADASTVNGSITASIGRSDWDRDLHFTTVNGQIALEIPFDTNADVKGSTLTGQISTDFPLVIEQVGFFRSYTLRGRLGIGGPVLSLSTINGNIALTAAK